MKTGESGSLVHLVTVVMDLCALLQPSEATFYVSNYEAVSPVCQSVVFRLRCILRRPPSLFLGRSGFSGNTNAKVLMKPHQIACGTLVEKIHTDELCAFGNGQYVQSPPAPATAENVFCRAPLLYQRGGVHVWRNCLFGWQVCFGMSECFECLNHCC